MSDEEVRRDERSARSSRSTRRQLPRGMGAQVAKIYVAGGTLFIPELRVTKAAFEGDRYFAQHFYALMNAAGAVERVVIVTQDITERKRTEQQLRESESLSRTVIEQSPWASRSAPPRAAAVLQPDLAAAVGQDRRGSPPRPGERPAGADVRRDGRPPRGVGAAGAEGLRRGRFFYIPELRVAKPAFGGDRYFAQHFYA